MNKLQNVFFISAAALLCSFAVPKSLEAQNEKIGTVNFKTCVENSKFGKQEQANFEAFKKQMEGVLEEKEKVLTEISSKFNDPDYLDSLSSDAEAELKHKFRSLSQEFSQHQQQYYQVLNQANYKIVQSVNESINEAASKVAKKKGLDVVFNDEGAFYHNASLDISDDVVKAMDEAFQEEEKK